MSTPELKRQRMEVNITVKYISVSPALTLPLCLTSAPNEVTVMQLKQHCLQMATELDITLPPAELQRLVHKGRVLRDDMLLSHYGLIDGENLTLLKVSEQAVQQARLNATAPISASAALPTAQASATPPNLTPPSVPAGGFGGGPLGGNPNRAMMEQMLRNPQMLEQAARSDPRLAGLLRDPRMREMMNQPQFMEQILRGFNPGAPQQQGSTGVSPPTPPSVPATGPQNPLANPQMAQMMANAMNDPNMMRQVNSKFLYSCCSLKSQN
jgi:uncharacterized ubiquitin-like protein YukD